MADGKVCLITGSTDGIGEETALALAGQGVAVVVHGRSREKAERVVERIKTETGNTRVEYMLADLASMESVRKLASQFRAKYDRLDILVNNAGASFLRRQETTDGYEKTFAINHLGHFLLTHLLLDLIESSALRQAQDSALRQAQDKAPARIVNVSSNAHRRIEKRVEDWHTRSGYWVMEAYGKSKLANVLFTYELARRLEGSGVTVNALHPGFVRTSIFRRIPILGPILDIFIGFAAISPQEGAQTSIYLATSPDLDEVTGQYFYESKPVRSSPLSYDRELAEELWKKSERWVGLDEDGR